MGGGCPPSAATGLDQVMLKLRVPRETDYIAGLYPSSDCGTSVFRMIVVQPVQNLIEYIGVDIQPFGKILAEGVIVCYLP